MKPERDEQTIEPAESVPPKEERVAESAADVPTPLPEELTEEVTERVTAPFAGMLNHDSVRWIHQNDLVDALERRHRQMTERVKQNPRTTGIIAFSVILLLLSFLIPVEPPHVSLAGESIGGPSWLTNSLLTTFIVDIILIAIAFLATRNISMVPGSLQNIMEAVMEYILNLCELVAGNRARVYFPWVMTIFLFVIISNWFGLLPGVGSIGFYFEPEHAEEHVEEVSVGVEQLGNEIASTDFSTLVAATSQEGEHQEGAVEEGATEEGAAEEGVVEEGAVEEGAAEEAHETHFVPLFRAPSADLNMTFALAIVTMVMVQVFGIRALGASYFGKFFVWHGPNIPFKLINGFVGILELFSEFSRLIAFGFRLFGNIFAGEIVLATMAFLIAFLLPIPFYLLEIFVGFVQALVFAMLALAFFTIATVSHGEHEH